MIDSTMDPRLAAQKANSQDLIRFKQQMDGLKERLAGPGQTKEAQLKKACQNFEAVFIGKLWQQMRQSVPKEGYLHSKQEESYLSMFDKDFSEKMAEAGGIGLADMIYSQLGEKLKEVSKTTLSGGVQIKPLAPAPIALDKPGGIPLDRTPRGMTLEEWGGQVAVNTSGGNAAPPAMDSGEIVSRLSGDVPTTRRMNDLEVQARLDELARRLEAQTDTMDSDRG